MMPDNPTHNRLETNKPTLQKNQGGSTSLLTTSGKHFEPGPNCG